MMLLEEFSEELADLRFGESPGAARPAGRAVGAADAAAIAVRLGGQIAAGLEAVKQGIERAWANVISVLAQFFDDAQAEGFSSAA